MKILVLASDRAELSSYPDDIIKCMTGVGPVEAGVMASKAISEADPDIVFGIGSCGAVRGLHELGEVVHIKCVFFQDMDLSLYHLPVGATLRYDRSTQREICLEEHGGVLATSGTFASSVTPFAKDVGASLFDMEGYAIASAAKAYGKKCFLIKGISDYVGEKVALKDYRAFLKELSSKIRKEVLATISREAQSV